MLQKREFFHKALSCTIAAFISVGGCSYAEDCYWLSRTGEGGQSFDQNKNWSDKLCPGKDDTVIFSDKAKQTTIEHTQQPRLNSELQDEKECPSFLQAIEFQGSKNFTVKISNSCSVTLLGDGVSNLGGNKPTQLADKEQTFLLTNKAKINFQGHSSADSGLSGCVEYNLNDSTLSFKDKSEANNVKIMCSNESHLRFENCATAGRCVIAVLNEGGDICFFGKSSAGYAKIATSESITFTDQSTADSACIQVKGDGNLVFYNGAQGAKSRVQLFSNASLRISQDNTLGSLNMMDQSTNLALGDHSLEIGSINEESRLDGRIEGSDLSSLVKVGKGQMIFGGDTRDFEGEIEIREGTFVFIKDTTLGSLELGSKGTMSLNDNISVWLGERDQNVNLAGKLEGAKNSQLYKVGNGHLRVERNLSAFHGKVVVNQGTLLFDKDGALDHVIIRKNGCLSGSAIMTGELKVEGTILLSSPKDVVIVTNDYHQSETGKYLVATNEKGDCALIKVKGRAKLEGKIEPIGNLKICAPYKVLEADRGIKGTFQPPQLSEKNIKFNIDCYDGKEVLLTLVPNIARGVSAGNYKGVAAQIDSIRGDKGDKIDVVEKLVSMHKGDLHNALDQLSGVQYCNLIIENERASDRFLRQIYNPIRFITQNQNCGALSYNKCLVWADVSSGKSFDRRKEGYEMDYFMVTGSMQYSLDEWSILPPCPELNVWTFGLAAGYANEKLNFNLKGNGQEHNLQAALYAVVTKSWYYAFLDVVFGFTTGEIERSIKCFDRRARGNIDISQVTLYGEFGLNNFCFYDIALQPYAGLEWGTYQLSEFKENGANHLNLQFFDHSSILTGSYLGVHLCRAANFDPTWKITADLSWKHLFNIENHLCGKFVHFGKKFTVHGPKIGLDGFEGSLGIYKTINESWIANLEFSGERWADYCDCYLSLGIFYSW